MIFDSILLKFVVVCVYNAVVIQAVNEKKILIIITIYFIITYLKSLLLELFILSLLVVFNIYVYHYVPFHSQPD